MRTESLVTLFGLDKTMEIISALKMKILMLELEIQNDSVVGKDTSTLEDDIKITRSTLEHVNSLML